MHSVAFINLVHWIKSLFRATHMLMLFFCVSNLKTYMQTKVIVLSLSCVGSSRPRNWDKCSAEIPSHLIDTAFFFFFFKVEWKNCPGSIAAVRRTRPRTAGWEEHFAGVDTSPLAHSGRGVMDTFPELTRYLAGLYPGNTTLRLLKHRKALLWNSMGQF